jgi:Ca2+-transporting ATPase
MSIPMALGSLWLFALECRAVTATSCLRDTAHARTLLLVCLALFQWFNAWNCRSEKKSILASGFFTNWWLIAATVLVLLLQIAVVYVPVLQRIFRTVPLTFSEWLLAGGVAFSIIVLEETRRRVLAQSDKFL